MRPERQTTTHDRPRLSGVIYGREGMGKTSLALQFPGPVHCMSVGETGYQDLEVVKQVPENSLNYVIESYEELVKSISKVVKGTVIIDSTKGLQNRIFDYVLRTFYQNNVRDFHAYSSGQRKESPQVFQQFLDLCSTKVNQGVNVVFIGHVGTIPLPNTLGADFLCHVINLDDGDKGLGMRSTLTAWASFIFFLSLDVAINRVTEKVGGLAMEGKAVDSDNRIIYTTLSTAHQAKNRWGMPPVIPMGRSPQEAWANLYKHFPEAYKKGA
jgi:hypothetical protein